MAIGQPVVIKPPRDASLYNVSHLYKCVISGDANLCSTGDSLDPGQGVNIFLDTADSNVDIPIFLFPSGTIVEDFGVEIFQVFTSDVNLAFGDSDATHGWGGSTTYIIATDTAAAGAILWASHAEDSDIVGVGSTAIIGSTAAFSASKLAAGPVAVYFDASDSGSTEWDSADYYDLDNTSSGCLAFAEVNLRTSGEVVESGGMNVYIRVNFANLARMAPSSDLGIYS